MELDALVAGGEYRSRKLELVRDANGDRVAELAVVPPLLVARCVAAQRGARPLPVVERAPVLARAADVFAGDVLGGLGFDEYVALTSRAAGLPISVARAGARAVLDGLRSAHVSVGAARPAGAAFGAR
ncbi:aldehyde dehydrogenase, partial [Tsukamurella sp. 8F]|nr:aldehyde dehydrogenase [Tsukamurella sp. 8F]